MTLDAWLQPLVYLAALTLIARPLGRWIADVLAGACHPHSRRSPRVSKRLW